MNLLHFQDVLENGGLAVQNVVVLVFSTSPKPLCQLPLSSFGGSLPSPAPTQSGLLYDHPSQGAEEGIDSSNFYLPKDINFQKCIAQEFILMYLIERLELQVLFGLKEGLFRESTIYAQFCPLPSVQNGSDFELHLVHSKIVILRSYVNNRRNELATWEEIRVG